VGIEGRIPKDHGDVAVFRREAVHHPRADPDLPLSIDSSPAIIRSRVDVPQPEGPTDEFTVVARTVVDAQLSNRS
jgi:hypothetical protein